MTSIFHETNEVTSETAQQSSLSSTEDKQFEVINKQKDITEKSNIHSAMKDLLISESGRQRMASKKIIPQSSSNTIMNEKKMENSDSTIVRINTTNLHDNVTPSSKDESKKSELNSAEVPPEKYDTTIDSNLPETVTLLRTPYGGKLYLVGTAHFSVESQNDVSKIIQAVQPHVVVMELCKARIAILQFNDEVMYQYSKNLSLQCISDTIKKDGLYNGLLHILLLRMASHIANELGMAPGGEFRRAFEEVKKLKNCVIYMGDRPIDVTIQRTLRSLSWWQTIKLGWNLMMMKGPMSKEDVELCKQKALLEEMVANMSKEFPVLVDVFIKERDIYLTYSLQMACSSLSTLNGAEPARVVGIVGIGHMQGIKENWGKVKLSDIPPILSIPPLSLSSKILRFTFKASLVGVVIYVGYKIIPLSSIKSSVGGLLKVSSAR